MHRLDHLGFTKPTPIQVQSIPKIMQGHDILGSAQTGTGKTGAFGIPLVAGLMSQPDGTALVITPTRELAQQVLKQLEDFTSRKARINTALLIGGDPYGKQLSQLRQNPRIICGTPGRINDHLERGTLDLSDACFLVLDETDRMLDMGFSVQIERILKSMPEERQTLLFSATLPKNIVQLSSKYMSDPVRISVATDNKIAENIDHKIEKVAEANKIDILKEELDKRTGSVIIFVKTKFGTERMATRLEKFGHKAAAIHGDLKQSKRGRVIQDFRNSKFRILVATDVAARGLDIPHIEHVINYDLPQSPEDYIHRIGRTARAGKKGEALAMVTPADRGKWNAIARLLDPTAKPEFEDVKEGKSGGGRRKSGGRRFGGGGRSEDGRSEGRRGDKPAGKAFGDKPRSAKPRGDKPFSGKPRSGGGGKPGGKPFGDRRSNGSKPSQRRSA